MKANEAPESKFVYPDKLYARCKDNKTLDISYAPQTLEAVEYTRTDVFMKKAKEGFCKAMCQGKPPRSTCTSLGTCKEYDDFVNYMKGE